MRLKNTFLKGTISLLVITVLVIAPLSSVKKTEAQTVGFGATNYSYSSGGGNSLSGIIGNLSPLIKKLPGCTSALGTGDLFGGIKNLFKSKQTKMEEKAKFNANDYALDDIAEDETLALTAIPVDTTTLNKKIDTMSAEQKTQGKTLGDVKKATESDNKNNTCLNAIGKAVIKMIIDKMTASIVNWIQTGNSGDSFFVKNPSKFFKDMAKEQILAFGQEIKDPTRFPFSKMFMTNVATSFNQTFQQNAQYSLNQIDGGWNTFIATTEPANNPFGFAIMASNEMQARIAGEAAQKTEELAQSGGFLGDERCADPEGVTREEDHAYNTGTVDPESGYTSWDTGQGIYTGTARKCNQWEYVTPGKTISEMLTKKMNNSEDALLSADTLNDAIAAILDAVIAKLSSKITTEGLAALSADDFTTNYNNDYDDNGLSAYQSNQTDQDFSDYERDSSPWLQGHPDFNIRTDVNEALIDEQRIYITKLDELNYALKHTDNTTIGGYNGLIPTIHQLDYCIPGPHPGWENDADRVLSKITGELWQQATAMKDDIKDNVGFAILDLFTLGFATTIVDTVNTYAFTCGTEENSKIYKLVAGAVNTLTGVDMHLPINAGHHNLCSPDGFEAIGEKALSEYSKVIKKHYNRQTLPSVAKEAETEFLKIAGYEQMLLDNEDAMSYQNGIVKRLEIIKTGIESLNPTSTTYEDDLLLWKSSFARIAPSLVSGGDIAHVDDLAKQAEAKRIYILNELIQGPVGCEIELKTWVPNPDATGPGNLYIHLLAPTSHDWNYQRPDYPKELPILYKYSTKTSYNYEKGLDGIQTPSVIVQPSTGAPSTGPEFQKSFLGSVPFAAGDVLAASDDGFDEDPTGLLVGDIPEGIVWWGNVLNLNSGLDNHTSIFNANPPGVGGNAAYLEKALGIY